MIIFIYCSEHVCNYLFEIDKILYNSHLYSLNKYHLIKY